MTLSTRGGPQRGAGKFEFLVLIAMIGVLAAAFIDRVRTLELDAERTELSLTLRNMRVGLTLAVGERIMQGREDRLPELLRASPVDFLGRLPDDYFAEPGQAAPSKSWRVDRSTGVATYYPRQPEAFGGSTELCWRITAQRTADGRTIGITLEKLTYCAT